MEKLSLKHFHWSKVRTVGKTSYTKTNKQNNNEKEKNKTKQNKTKLYFFLKKKVEVELLEGDIGVCGIAVSDNFSCGISVILILNCGIAVFSKPAGCGFGILDGIKNSPSSPPTFSELFPVFDRFISC